MSNLDLSLPEYVALMPKKSRPVTLFLNKVEEHKERVSDLLDPNMPMREYYPQRIYAWRGIGPTLGLRILEQMVLDYHKETNQL